MSAFIDQHPQRRGIILQNIIGKFIRAGGNRALAALGDTTLASLIGAEELGGPGPDVAAPEEESSAPSPDPQLEASGGATPVPDGRGDIPPEAPIPPIPDAIPPSPDLTAEEGSVPLSGSTPQTPTDLPTFSSGVRAGLTVLLTTLPHEPYEGPLAKIDLTPFPAMIHDLYVKLIELNLSTDDICELYSLAISLSSGGRSRETLSFQVRQNMDSSRATRDNNLKFTTRLLIKAGRDQLQEAIAALSAGGLDVPVRP